ncbi:MAG TPA: heavy metal-binding domain-containing protein [Methanobacteriaceae archaeon]|nr:heavy metal-binding domain-containing protein [Methanobacteriaceae archaeon]
MVSVEKNYFIEKRWGLVAVFLGVFVGFVSAYICIKWNLVIFGFNIMYILSPLMAGFVETFVARRKYGKSTGAISALLTFLLINGYGWLAPGWILPKQEPVTLSLITIIALALTIQAAFPILVNYILFVVVVGTFTRIVGFLMYIPSKIQRRIPETEMGEVSELSADETFLDELAIPLVSVPHVGRGKLKKYVGLVTGEAVAEEKESIGMLSKLMKIIQPTQLDDLNLGDARKVALSRMLEDAESMGANTVIEVLVNYVSVGGLSGNATIVTATGTAVVYE